MNRKLHPTPALIGQAPGSGRGNSRLHSDWRLAKLVGLTAGELRERVDWMNLLSFYPGRAFSRDGKPVARGDHFPFELAKQRAAMLTQNLGTRRVVLLGLSVAMAFRVEPQPMLTWRVGPPGALYAVMAHPSGVSRWWNEPANRERAAAFLRELLAL